MKRIERIDVRETIDLPADVMRAGRPLVLENLVADWPLVQAARQSNRAADKYLRRYYNGKPVTVSVGGPDIGGRIFYNDEMTGFNFATRRAQLDDVLDEILCSESADNPPVHYVGSTTVDLVLPGFREENDLAFHGVDPMMRIWIGNRTRIAAHFDVPDNIACVAAGRRRFTLFPPDQLENLYIGPLDLTPAGQAISLVDPQQPDFEKYPRFREALRHASSAELEPGDAIFIPGMWWHQVEGLGPLNILVNYWWRGTPAYLGGPLDALNHAFLSIRDLPVEQREIWRDIFDRYIFRPGDAVSAHIPAQARGILEPLTEDAARRLRALLMRNLNR